MKRMKRLISTLACALAVLIGTCILVPIMEVRGASTVNSVVYPTGVWPDDVHNVQVAVNLGGTVLLKATNTAGQPTAFNFGTPESLPDRRVFLSIDVSVLGERVGSNMTTIQGGRSPISCLVPVKSRIQGIDFEGPLHSAILIAASTGSEIIGNRINGVVPDLTPIGFVVGDGLDVLGDDDSITGKVRVADNVIENLHAHFSSGIQFDRVAAEVEITGNTIHIYQSEGIAATHSHNSVSIETNFIISGPGNPGSEGNGILIGGDPDAVYHVSRNTVISENPFADGIILFGGVFFVSEGTIGAVVEKNNVTMHNSLFGGISLYGRVTDAYVGENTIEGDGAFALQAFGFGPANPTSANRFQGNNISHFTASVADVFFGPNTQDNVLLGDCSSVIDLGVNNFVTCGQLTSGNLIGEQMATAHARKLEALQRLTSVDRRAAMMSDR
jgi:Right handed beta helix region